MTLLSRSVWLGLKQETRADIARLFDLTKSSGVEVSGNQVVSDGYTDRDLAALKVESLQQFLKSEETDFYVLFNNVVKHIETMRSVGIEVLTHNPNNEPNKEHKEEVRSEERPEAGKVETAGSTAKARGRSKKTA